MTDSRIRFDVEDPSSWRRLNGQSPAPDDDVDLGGLDPQPHGLTSCDVCGNDSASYWLNFNPPPHAPDITFPPRVRGCANCESFARAGNTQQLLELMYAGEGGWPEDRDELLPIAEAFIQNYAGSEPLA